MENSNKYIEINGKYLKDAKELIEKKDYMQASEKYWGAAATIIKAVALKRGEELQSHGEIYKFINKLVEELSDDELLPLFASARELHTNFYENWLPAENVIKYGKSVEKFVKKLEPLTIAD